MHTGSPSITSLLFDRNTTSTLICISTGGPPTAVTWRRNGVLVAGSLYRQTQIIVDPAAAVYKNILSINERSDIGDNFTCEVRNIRGGDQQTLLHST